MLQKEIKDLTFKVFNLSTLFLKKIFPVRDLILMTSTRKGGGKVLKSVTCLQILLFLNNRSVATFCGWGVAVSGWFVDIIIV